MCLVIHNKGTRRLNSQWMGRIMHTGKKQHRKIPLSQGYEIQKPSALANHPSFPSPNFK